MAKHTKLLAANGDVHLADVIRRRDAQSFGATVFFQGTFGSGTATLQISPDGGLTKHTVFDENGDDIVFTQAGYANFVFGNASDNAGDLSLYVNLAGATSPSLSIILFDNR